MNKTTQMILLVLVALPVIIVLFAQFGLFAGSPPLDLGITAGRLKAPSKNENSVSSQAAFFNPAEANIDYAKIEPFIYIGDGKAALSKLKEVISSSFGEAVLITENENYLRYEFKTKLMKYTDDVEFLLNSAEKRIDFRSASRLGRKDFGKNRVRMEEIRKKFNVIN